MISNNQHIDLSSLPEHQPDADLWNQIEFELDILEMLNDLPIHKPDTHLWDNIAMQLSIAPTNKRTWIRYSVLLLILFAGFFIVRSFYNYDKSSKVESPTLLQTSNSQENRNIEIEENNRTLALNPQDTNSRLQNEFSFQDKNLNNTNIESSNELNARSIKRVIAVNEAKKYNTIDRNKPIKNEILLAEKQEVQKNKLSKNDNSSYLQPVFSKHNGFHIDSDSNSTNSNAPSSNTENNKADAIPVLVGMDTKINSTITKENEPISTESPTKNNKSNTIDNLDSKPPDSTIIPPANQDISHILNQVETRENIEVDSVDLRINPKKSDSLLMKNPPLDQVLFKKEHQLDFCLSPYFEYRKTNHNVDFKLKQNDFGIGVQFKVQRNKLNIETGIGLSRASYNMNTYGMYQSVDTLDSYFYVDSIIYTFSIPQNNYIKTYIGHDRYITDSTSHSMPIKGKSSYTTLEIPLFAGYQLYNKRISLNLKVGLIYAYVINRDEISYTEQPSGLSQSMQKSAFLQNNALNSYMGIQASYQLNSKVSLWIEPSAYYYILPLFKDANGNSIQSSAYGLKAGIGIKI